MIELYRELNAYILQCTGHYLSTVSEVISLTVITLVQVGVGRHGNGLLCDVRIESSGPAYKREPKHIMSRDAPEDDDSARLL